MSYESDFKTETGVNFAILGAQAKIIWLIDLAEPGHSTGISVYSRLDEICSEIDAGWPGYTIVYRHGNGAWEELLKEGGKLQETPVKSLSTRSWDGKVPTEKEIAEWIDERAVREKLMLISSEDAAILFSCALRLVNDMSAGVHSAERGRTELSANVLSLVSGALADLDWNRVDAVKGARKRIKELCDSEPALMRTYAAVWAFGKGA